MMVRFCTKKGCNKKAEPGNRYCTSHNIELKVKTLRVLDKNQQNERQ